MFFQQLTTVSLAALITMNANYARAHDPENPLITKSFACTRKVDKYDISFSKVNESTGEVALNNLKFSAEVTNTYAKMECGHSALFEDQEAGGAWVITDVNCKSKYAVRIAFWGSDAEYANSKGWIDGNNASKASLEVTNPSTNSRIEVKCSTAESMQLRRTPLTITPELLDAIRPRQSYIEIHRLPEFTVDRELIDKIKKLKGEMRALPFDGSGGESIRRAYPWELINDRDYQNLIRLLSKTDTIPN